MKVLLYFVTILISLNGCTTLAQSKKVNGFTDEIDFKDYAIIKIDYLSERYYRYETNILYRNDTKFKLHSIIKESSNIIDTVFVLNGRQLMLIDKYFDDVKNDKLTSGEMIVAGSISKIQFITNGETNEYLNKIDYSLYHKLIKLE